MSNISSTLLGQSTCNVTLMLPDVPSMKQTATATGGAFESDLIIPLYVIIFVLSVAGNSLVLITLAQNTRMRTVTNVFLLNLAVSDLLLGVFCMPFTLVGQVLRNFIFGHVMCKLVPYFQAVSVSVGVWTLVAISLERYFAICRPLKSRRWQTRFHAYKMIGFVWLASLACNLPILVVSRLQAVRDTGRHKCREEWPSAASERSFNIGLDLVLLVVPLIIMALAYSLIVTKLCKRHVSNTHHTTAGTCAALISASNLETGATQGPALGVTAGRRCLARRLAAALYCHGKQYNRSSTRCRHAALRSESRKKVVRMLSVVVLEFFVCWTPLHVLNTCYLFQPEAVYSALGSTGVALVQLLAYISSCCNPITYCFMNAKFRHAFIAAFSCSRLARRGSANNSASTVAKSRAASMRWCLSLKCTSLTSVTCPPHHCR